MTTAFHEALPLGQVLSGKQNFPVRLLQDRTQRKPLAGPVECIGALRPGIALPGHRLNIGGSSGAFLLNGSRSRVMMSLRRRLFFASQHVRLLTNRITAEYPLFARLIFGAVKIIVRGDVAD